MPNKLAVKIEPLYNTAAEHDRTATLKFNGRVVWGPKSCHYNVSQLGEAITGGDPRFEFEIVSKDKSAETHTKSITVEVNNKVVLSGFSAHENMVEMVEQINHLTIFPDIVHT
ncbi:hypothetical protein B0J18DRAFT_436958 [Chaetomium sp. MPI-SDFR-AT-0129]|nr:hypothetical protein B0J18DRAFT_436958 [Chaetomium sp. MPI-SDFR-AT-0129]